MLQPIVLSVCMLLAPTQCKDVHLQTASEFGASLQVPFNCVRQGQIEGQKWIEQHPGWRIERWKCPPVDRREVSFCAWPA
jgi:hypothetical protein